MNVPYPVVASVAAALLIISAALAYFAQNRPNPPVGKSLTYPMIGGCLWGALLYIRRANTLGMNSYATTLDILSVLFIGIACLAAAWALFTIRKAH